MASILKKKVDSELGLDYTATGQLFRNNVYLHPLVL
jgi:hypothetical protein